MRWPLIALNFFQIPSKKDETRRRKQAKAKGWKDAMKRKRHGGGSGNEAAASHSIASARFKNSFGMPRRGIL